VGRDMEMMKATRKPLDAKQGEKGVVLNRTLANVSSEAVKRAGRHLKVGTNFFPTKCGRLPHQLVGKARHQKSL
jgi:hypothetical protein